MIAMGVYVHRYKGFRDNANRVGMINADNGNHDGEKNVDENITVDLLAIW